MENLASESIPQIAWYLQIKDEMPHSKRPIDKMTTAEIVDMYEQKNFLCDTCGKELGKCDFSLQDHVIHLINPMILWSCEDCLINDVKNSRIIGSTKEPNPQNWH